jgi:hypothetical protein
MATRLDLWNQGKLEEMAARAKSLTRPPSRRSKVQRAARRAAKLLRKNQFARAASLSSRLGVANATEDIINGIAPLFPKPCVVSQQDLLDYFGPPAPPPPLLEDPLPTVVTLDPLRKCLAENTAPILPTQRRLEKRAPRRTRQRSGVWHGASSRPHRSGQRRRPPEKC